MATSVADLMAKARRALKSAHLVFSDGDPDSACNRAYYAMFNAARAALLAEGRTKEALGKTHAGLIAAFALHLVKPGKIEIDQQRALGGMLHLRTRADYFDESVSAEDARDAIEKAEAFVTAVGAYLAPGRSVGKDD